MIQWRQFLDRCTGRSRTAAFVVDVVQVYFDRRVSRSAAELAYYLVLTLFPILIMVTGIVGMLPLDPDWLLPAIERIMPSATAGLLGDYLGYVLQHRSAALFAGGLLTTVTAASAAFRSLVSISGEIFGRRAFRGVWYFLFSWLFSLLLLVMIYLSLVVVLTGNWFIRLLRRLFPFLSLPLYWPVTRLVLLFAVAMLFLMLLYRVTAPRGRSQPPVLAGACLTALLLTLFSSAFSVLISFSSRYSLVYGSLASVVILMVWLYLCGNIVILGNVFNYVRWRHKRGLPVAFLLEKRL